MDIYKLLRIAKKKNASDLQLVVDSPPLLRIHGTLEPIDKQAQLKAEDIDKAFTMITTPEERETFHNELELDFGYTLPGVGRLRCNAAKQQSGTSLAIRLLSQIVPSIDELELPQIYKYLSQQPRGLLLVSGPTDSGKTTSIAAMVLHLNQTAGRHIVAIEDPIEYVHTRIKSAITQRQLGRDTRSYSQALKHVLRQNPDVIVVGEIRDLDTAAAVMNISETGRLVLSTSHASSAPQALERIIDLFPPHERQLAQARLATLVVAIVCQTLVPRTDGSGRIAAVEIMLASSPIRSLIRDGKIFQIPNVIRTHHEMGMISLDESLVGLYLDRVISHETLFAFANDHREVEKLISTDYKPKKAKRK
jgi:twitching motility protein PilT